MDLKDLDTYMVKRFENSQDIRNSSEFRDTITQFLQENKNYRNKCSRENNGYIRVVYTNKEGYICPIKAYYKQDKAKLNVRSVKANIKKQCCTNKYLLKFIRQKYGSIMSEFHRYYINMIMKDMFSDSYKKYIINDWVEALSNRKSDGYLQIRNLNRDIEKYLEVNPMLTTNKGTISNIKNDSFDEEIILKKEEPHEFQIIKQAMDPDELFSTFDLDELTHMEKDDINGYVKVKKN